MTHLGLRLMKEERENLQSQNYCPSSILSMSLPSTKKTLRNLGMDLHPVKVGSTEEDFQSISTSPESMDSDDDFHLIFKMNPLRDIPDTYVIPNHRICTPRTPKILPQAKSQPRRTLSPSDFLRTSVKSPKDLLIERYKRLAFQVD